MRKGYGFVPFCAFRGKAWCIAMSKYKDMTDDCLRDTFVPNVYQKTIYDIDYDKLKEAGVKCISFDIDDTIAGFENVRLPMVKPPKAALALFIKLKADGFIVILLTNAAESRARRFGDALDVSYIARAEKPRSHNFQKIIDQFNLHKTQLAHVGNHIIDDIAGGNMFGAITCLVRRVGRLTNRPPLTGRSEGQKIRAELKIRNIWRKHHKHEKDDQYYQLGESPRYTKK